ncbi:MAG: CDP-alcohol phosphatidyltransferase family protein [Candidatus Diapherotrites archaeon]|nr:CDP-alcohol phosphatidyltransferase family protein [Candidatus Diapherotrites archaeon]
MLGKPFRKWIERDIAHPIGCVVARTGLTANQVTALSIPLAIIGAYCLYAHEYVAALIFMFWGIFIDNIDGAVARATKNVTRWGSYFDAMMDKYVEMIIFVGFAAAGYPFESLLAAASTMLNSYAKPALAIRIPLGNEDWPAVGERGDRLALLLIGFSAAILWPSVNGFDSVSLLLLFISVFVFFGGLQRMMFARKLINEYERTRKRLMVRK